jgi:TatD DNase family protein
MQQSDKVCRSVSHGIKLIDTHCHIDLGVFDKDYTEVLDRARAAGVSAMILPGVDRGGWARLLDLCIQEPDLYPALGLHPMYLRMHHSGDLNELQRHVDQGGQVAIGEIGLDYYVEGIDRQQQQELFEAQLDIASAADLPVLLHVRKAHDQVLATLRRRKFRQGGIVHAFAGSFQQAEHYIKLGFKLSFGGTLTYDRSKRIRAVARQLPLEAIVLETDAPDIPVSSHSGERNSPEYLPEILDALTELRTESKEMLAAQTTENARIILGLP